MIFITYADNKFKNAQLLQSVITRFFGFKRYIAYAPTDIDDEFRAANKELLSNPKGGGVWLWKPYFILKTLNQCKSGDWLFYMDAGAFPIANSKKFKALCDSSNSEIIVFELPVLEWQFTHNICLKEISNDQDKFAETNMIHASYMLIKNTLCNRRIIESWLTGCMNKNFMSEALSNLPNFQEHRYDQSVFSLTVKANNISPFFDISQLRNNHSKYSCNPSSLRKQGVDKWIDSSKRLFKLSMSPKLSNKTLVFHHRNPNPIRIINFLKISHLFKTILRFSD